MERIKMSDLEYQVQHLNAVRGIKHAGYNTPNAYHIGQAYGGYRLEMCTGENGGIRVISPNGYGTKRELYNFLQGLHAGMRV